MAVGQQFDVLPRAMLGLIGRSAVPGKVAQFERYRATVMSKAPCVSG